MQKPSYYRPEYDLLARFFDFGVWLAGFIVGSEKRIRRLTMDALALKEGQRVLDICCGTGTVALMAGKMGAKAFGLDISMGMLEVAKKKILKNNLEARFVLANSEVMPFRAAVFDRAVASVGLHEMPVDAVKNTILEVKRVLKDGSRFVIFDYHKTEGFIDILQRLFFIFTEHETARDFIRFDIQKELADVGFKNFKKIILAKGALQLISCEV